VRHGRGARLRAQARPRRDRGHGAGGRRARAGQALGTLGAFGCFSFYPGKNLGAAGEAGAIATDDEAAAERMASLRHHGQSERYRHEAVGYNYRMEGVQGLVLGRKLKELDRWTDRRHAIAARYRDGLAGQALDLPADTGRDHVFHLFVIRHGERDALRRHLAERQIETGLHYPIPLHRQPCLRPWVHERAAFPAAEDWAERGLSLPIYYGMTDDQVDRVIEAIRAFLVGARRSAA
jgi:dTDP-4-amino-4,6-dideoxygalactose transaminase